jgi:ABC-type bacteriocin/lantibiotic exporter with double-glycine peptidase domain
VGLIDKSHGKIYVDNQEISEKLKLTNKIGYVPQETFLIDDTIENNICLGLSEQSDKLKINQIIKETQLEDLIKNLPLGLQTHIGEKGLRISGGQRQRLGIARALYTNPSILVFDEATSSLDTETENEILDVIKELKNEKTIIVVTHKSNISDLCDHLYRLQNKKIIKVK